MKFNQLYLLRGCRKPKCTPTSRKQFNFIDALTHFNLSRRVLFLWVLSKQEECAKKAFALFNLPNSSCLVLAFVSHSLLCLPTLIVFQLFISPQYMVHIYVRYLGHYSIVLNQQQDSCLYACIHLPFITLLLCNRCGLSTSEGNALPSETWSTVQQFPTYTYFSV